LVNSDGCVSVKVALPEGQEMKNDIENATRLILIGILKARFTINAPPIIGKTFRSQFSFPHFAD